MAVEVRGTVVSPSRGSSGVSNSNSTRGVTNVSGQNMGAVGQASSGPASIIKNSPATSPSYSYNSGMNQDAANQIVYLKNLYDQAVAANKPKSSLTSISNKAQDFYKQLDPTTANQLKGMNAQQAAAWYQGYKDEQNNKVGTPATSLANTPQAVQPTQAVQQPSDPYADIMNSPMYQQLMGMMDQYQQQQSAYAQQQAQQQAYMQEMQRNNFNSLISQYQNAQANDLAALDRNFEASKAELGDNAFQDYLRAQQAMANRGLAGSGLANDQDTRLLMANNKNLTNLQNSVLNQKAQIQQQYQGQIGNLQQQLAAINFPSVAGGSVASRDSAATAGRMAAPDATTLNMMFDIWKEANPYAMATVKDQMDYSRNTQKDMMDYMVSMMPYQQATVKDQMDYYATMSKNQQTYAIDQAKLKFDYDKLGSEEKRFYDGLNVESQMKLAQMAQDYDLKMTDLMGYDKNGTPTFAANKFITEFNLDKWYKEQSVQQGWSNIQIKQYTAEQNAAQGWSQLEIAQQNANTRIAELEVKAQEIKDKNQRNAFLDQMNAANKLRDAAFKDMQTQQKLLDSFKDPQGKDKQAYDEAFERYQKARKQYELSYDAIDTLAQLNINDGVDRSLQGALTASQSQMANSMGVNTQGLLNKFNGGTAGGQAGGKSLGSLSSKYESRGDAGTVARNSGDSGGASYGTYQFTTNQGSAKGFVQSLKNTAPDIYKKLAAHPVGSVGFDAAWKQVAKTHKNFGQLQHDYAEKTFYQTAAAKMLKSTGIDPSKRSNALQQVVWSTSVQHGAGGANSVFKNAGITPAMSDAEIIKRIYAERGAKKSNGSMKYFGKNSAKIQAGVANRFKNELKDALKMLG